jgi:hypothetical protein
MTNHYLIRDHKGFPARIEAVNFTDACQKLKLVPAKCTAEVLDTSVPYQKWDVIDVKAELRTVPRKPAKQRTVAKTTPIPTIPTTCTVCGTKFLAVRSSRTTCSDKCRVRKFRNDKQND